MKNRPLCTLLLILLAPLLPAQEPKEYLLPAVPENVEAFIPVRDLVGKTPEGSAALVVTAMIKYTEDPVEGMKLFTVLLVNDGSQHRKISRGGYKGLEPSASNLFLIGKLDTAPWIARSLVAGTVYSNGYALPEAPRMVRIIRRSDAIQPDGSVKLYLVCSGSDTPRPLRLKANDKGVWKVAEFSSLFVDVKKPIKPSDDL